MRGADSARSKAEPGKTRTVGHEDIGLVFDLQAVNEPAIIARKSCAATNRTLGVSTRREGVLLVVGGALFRP